MKGKPKPYVHVFEKSGPGQVEVVERAINTVSSGDIFQDFLSQIDVARAKQQVCGLSEGIVRG